MQPSNLHLFYIVGLVLMSVGYGWLWTFKTNPHILVKFLTMQAYLLCWIYFLVRTLKKTTIFGYQLINLFELNLVLQITVTSGYWLMIHDQMLKYLNLPGTINFI